MVAEQKGGGSTEDVIQGAYRGPYLRRAGEGVLPMLETLVKEPEVRLSPEQRTRVIAFENALFDHEIAADGLTINEALRDGAVAEDKESPMYFGGYFAELPAAPEHASDGLKAAYDFMADHIAQTDGDKIAAAHTGMAQLVGQREELGLADADFLTLAKASTDWYKRHMKKALLNDTPPDRDIVRFQPIVINPEITLARLEKLQRAREFVRERRADRMDSADNAAQAEAAVLDVYTSKINAQIAGHTAALFYLEDQLKEAPDAAVSSRLAKALPPAFAAAAEDKTRRMDVLRRLDYLQYGMGLDREGRASGVAEQIWHVGRTAIRHREVPVYSAEDAAKLANAKLSTTEMQQVFSDMLQKAGLLSQEDGDDGWKVEISETGTTFAVDSRTKTFTVPSEEKDLATVILVGAEHESEHINQALIDDQLAQTLRIAGAKGKRVGMLREGGANARQRRAQLHLFGAAQAGPNLTYAKARQLLDAGSSDPDQSFIDAVKVFYDEKMSLAPDARDNNAKEAVDRVLRLERRGRVNSQPLAYAEEWLLIDALAHEKNRFVAERAARVTTLDFVDQARLHRFGLLPDISEVRGITEDIVQETLAPHIHKALTSEAA